MEKVRKLELIQRSLGLRHKIKVHESMKAPETHEELSVMTLVKWELEDELHAIEQLLGEIRFQSVQAKKKTIGEDPGLTTAERESAAQGRVQSKVKKKSK